MKRLLLVGPNESSRRAIAAQLRGDGHDVLETDEEHALLLYREGDEAVLVWSAHDASRALNLVQELHQAGRPPLVFSAPPPSANASSVPSLPRPELIGEVTSMRDLRATLRRLAHRPRTHVLVGGEPGTGKQTFARVLHLASRPAQEFLHASPARLAALLDGDRAEFGQHGGTLYVPSLAEVSKPDQRRLASLLIEHEGSGFPPVRLVVGVTLGERHAPLERVLREVAHPELASRLPVLLELLPLRKRKSDIPLLVAHFLSAWSASSRLPRPAITQDAIKKLVSHTWPGNLRELANVIENAALTADGGIDPAELPNFERSSAGMDYELPSAGIDLLQFERAVLAQALELSGGNQTRAASLLGLTRDQIRYRMNKFGILRAPAAGSETQTH